MEMYQVVLHDGTKGHLTENQALRISKIINDHPKYSKDVANHQKHKERQEFLVKNDQKFHHLMHYLKQEYGLNKCPKTEEQLLELMYHKMPIWSETEVMNFHKMIEVIISRYIREIFDQID